MFLRDLRWPIVLSTSVFAPRNNDIYNTLCAAGGSIYLAVKLVWLRNILTYQLHSGIYPPPSQYVQNAIDDPVTRSVGRGIWVLGRYCPADELTWYCRGGWVFFLDLTIGTQFQ
jgi:hypothetical protein